MSPKQHLSTFTAEAAGQIPSEVLTRLERTIDDLRSAGIVAGALTRPATDERRSAVPEPSACNPGLGLA